MEHIEKARIEDYGYKDHSTTKKVWKAIQTIVLVLAIIALSIYEVLTAPQKDLPRAVYFATFIIVIYFVYWIFIKNNFNSFNQFIF